MLLILYCLYSNSIRKENICKYTTINIPENYYCLTDINGKLNCWPCYASCRKCSIEGNEDYHKCIACAENYFKTLDSDNCYLETDINVLNYYLDIDLVYKKCYETCSKCVQPGTLENNFCDKCTDDTYSVSHQIGQCVSDCEDLYYKDTI